MGVTSTLQALIACASGFEAPVTANPHMFGIFENTALVFLPITSAPEDIAVLGCSPPFTRMILPSASRLRCSNVWAPASVAKTDRKASMQAVTVVFIVCLHWRVPATRCRR